MESINAANSGILKNSHKDKKKTKETKKKENTSFVSQLKSASLQTNATLPLEASVEAELDDLLEAVTENGENLKKNQTFNYVKKYRQSVQRFMRYIVDNAFNVERVRLTKFQVLKRKGQPELTMLTVVNEKLDKLAAGILQNQFDQLEVLARVDEVNGLLVDLIQ